MPIVAMVSNLDSLKLFNQNQQNLLQQITVEVTLNAPNEINLLTFT